MNTVREIDPVRSGRILRSQSVTYSPGGDAAFAPVAQDPDLPSLEERVLALWRDLDVVRRSLDPSSGRPLFMFYEGPPTANGRPGVHHVEARVFKDIFPRYQTMKGRYAPRKAGWDCHGIPVELEVEKKLGFNQKRQIEEYGVGKFNADCRESVTKYVHEFESLTDRIGFWVDTDNAYWTMSREYVESVWWSLKELFDRGLLYEDHRVVPYCPRCGTALSDHEVSLGYAETVDPSIYVRFPVLTGPLAGGTGAGSAEAADLLVWTTMPWTLISATAAVVDEGTRYVLARGGRAGDRAVVLAAERLSEVLGADATVVRDVGLDELVGARYRAPFDFVGPGSQDDPGGDPSTWRFVVTGDFVDPSEGTGIVHTGAAFGKDDMRVARENGMPMVKPVDAAGCFDERVRPYAGMFVRDADAHIIEDLAEGGLLVASESHTHSYPFCWRCRTPLLYYAKPCWYIATSGLRERLVEENAGVDWRPPHIRDGRYGNWVANNVDWALSRERYWGTPLPVWRCDRCDRSVAVGSLAELGALVDRDLSALDPHRPYVDEVTFACSASSSECDGLMRRVPEVIDAWYDSGAMPFAQFGYPHAPGSRELFEERFPADYICEAIDQTRGWFYSLHAEATLLFDRNAYRLALCLGHIVDEDGRKMSTSLGNVRDPWALIDEHGADALRWLLLVDGNPWHSRRVGDERLSEVRRKFLLTLWNTYYFFVTYANLAHWSPNGEAPPSTGRPVMDRYILAELAEATAEIDAAMRDFDATTAGQRIARFVDDLSNWYVRRSRSRFWTGGSSALHHDAACAFSTLHTCLTTLAGLLAPFTPFIAEELYQNLVRSTSRDAADSVHLTPYPEVDDSVRDDALRQEMAVARQLVTLGRDARSAAGVPVRQPLRRAVVTGAGDLADEIREVVASELNVKELASATDDEGAVVTVCARPNFRALGPVFGKRTEAVAAAIRQADARAIVRDLENAGVSTVEIDGERFAIDGQQVEIVEQPVSGWHTSSGGSYSVSIDLGIDEDLRLEGLAREFVRLAKDLRRRLGLSVSEHVEVDVALRDDPGGHVAAMFGRHHGSIAAEIFARTLSVSEHAADGTEASEVGVGEGRALVSIRRV